MLKIPSVALPLLITVADEEIARLAAIADAVGDDWPIDFDLNDIELFRAARDELLKASNEEPCNIGLGGKPLSFLLMAMKDYVNSMGTKLPRAEYQVLKTLYETHLPDEAGSFPTR